MSVRVLSNVFGNFHEDSEASDRLVLIFLADAAHDDGIAWPSQPYIAERLRLGERTVRRSIDALAKRGEIEVRKASRGRARVNVYRVTAAPLDPQYDRLPFALAEPFTTGHDGRPSDDRPPQSDDRPSAPATTGQNRSDPGSGPSSLTVTGNREEPSADKPPKLPRIGGRDLPLDALAEVCGIDPANRTRMGEAAQALKGTARDQGIIDQFWIEYKRWLQDRGPVDFWTNLDPVALTEALVAAIHLKALLYRQRFEDTVELTPRALRKWWLDLHPTTGGDVNSDDLRAGRA